MLKRCYNCEQWVEIDLTQKTTPCPYCGAQNLFHGDKEERFFFLVPNKDEQAKELLSYYKVQTEPWKSWLIVTDHPLGQDDHRLAEMAFQMNWHQVGHVCPLCSSRGKQFCGHLAFTRPIG